MNLCLTLYATKMLITSVKNWSAIVILRFVFVALNSFLSAQSLNSSLFFDPMLLDLIFSCRLPSLLSAPDCVFSSLTWRKPQCFPAISTSHCGEVFLKYVQACNHWVIFKRNSHCLKALSVPTLVVKLCEVWEDNVPLTASLMSPGLPQPVYQRMNMLLCWWEMCYQGLRWNSKHLCVGAWTLNYSSQHKTLIC